MSKEEPLYRKFIAGGAAAMAGSAASHPLDVIKVRLQVQGENSVTSQSAPKKLGPVAMGIKIFKDDGISRGLFKGLSASLLRQGVYSSVRFGFYDFFNNKFHQRNRSADPNYNGVLPLTHKVMSGLASGAIGSFVGNPCDVLLVRMQADASKPIAERRNYKSLADGFTRIIREEGFLSLYNGVVPTVTRAMIVTAAQFASYDQIKEFLVSLGHGKLFPSDSVLTHFTGGFLAGFVASVVSNPVDVVKTRMMNMRENEYKNPIDCVSKTLKNEGPLAFYKGFVPTFSRQAPYVVVMFVTMEQIKKLYFWLDS